LPLLCSAVGPVRAGVNKCKKRLPEMSVSNFILFAAIPIISQFKFPKEYQEYLYRIQDLPHFNRPGVCLSLYAVTVGFINPFQICVKRQIRWSKMKGG
jgi:hypothetical protein